ncbi:MAG: UbiX family flavin prenyltransferase [Candidatus Aenigmarchaeota archaeon]|nr:UbiX family flavin prenyltransferase [Candidatus Aenigmarchaeota archaeon]
MKKIIAGISGASGSILGIRLLQELKGKAETHLIITDAAKKILEYETGFTVKQVEKLATKSYSNSDFFAPAASGSFKTDGMVIIPCSMKTLAGIASGFSDNLLLRCADVTLKERRKLVLVARETPLSYIHVKNMETVSQSGAIILPPVLSFYSKPKSIDDMVNHIVGKTLDMLGFENTLYKRWK